MIHQQYKYDQETQCYECISSNTLQVRHTDSEWDIIQALGRLMIQLNEWPELEWFVRYQDDDITINIETLLIKTQLKIKADIQALTGLTNTLTPKILSTFEPIVGNITTPKWTDYYNHRYQKIDRNIFETGRSEIWVQGYCRPYYHIEIGSKL